MTDYYLDLAFDDEELTCYYASQPPKFKATGPGKMSRMWKRTQLRKGKFGEFYGRVDFPKCKGNRNKIKGEKMGIYVVYVTYTSMNKQRIFLIEAEDEEDACRKIRSHNVGNPFNDVTVLKVEVTSFKPTEIQGS